MCPGDVCLGIKSTGALFVEGYHPSSRVLPLLLSFITCHASPSVTPHVCCLSFCPSSRILPLLLSLLTYPVSPFVLHYVCCLSFCPSSRTSILPLLLSFLSMFPTS
ncbi:hypothetical protein Pcinc_038339 [Petrolisthes cinctipes]|uniref:Uncharacterized protein n=1 Tax=Petrolisthes cinctipes TaxID=88211 RepID=A0AAE1BQR9_PETCI|nr:hypothetical protein Pcinc_038339 [Petrolisthes cinctipes]